MKRRAKTKLRTCAACGDDLPPASTINCITDPQTLWKCIGCKRRFHPTCSGAADDMPDHCDDCFSEAHNGAA
jgi:hypothetical protein